MTYIEPTSLKEIVIYVESVISQTDNLSSEDIASSIVGATLANNSIEVEDLYKEFPELLDVAETAADLEFQYTSWQWNKLIENFEKLKEKVEKRG